MCGGKKTTTSTETAPMSERGLMYDSLLSGIITTNLETSGYNLSSEEVTEYQDPTRAKQLNLKMENVQNQITNLETDINSNPYRGSGKDPRQTQLASMKNDLYKSQNELLELPQDTYTKYDVQKAPDPRLQDAIDRYGENSPEATGMRDQIKQEAVDKAVNLAGIEKTTLENIKKYVNGDMSYTEEQKNQVESYFAPIRDVINKSTDDLLSKYGDDETKMRESLNDLSDQIEKSGFEIGDALKAAEIQIDKSGSDLLGVLKRVNESTEAKFKFKQDLLFQEIDQQAAQQAAFLGLPPGSQSEQLQKAKMKQDVFSQLQLDLAEQELKGELSIAERTAGKKEEISLSRVALAASQAEKKEGVAKTALGITEKFTGLEEAAIAARGNAFVQLEADKSKQLQEVAYGSLPARIAAGQGGLGFDQGYRAGELNIAQTGAQPVAGQLGVEQQRQFAEATTTQKSGGGFLDTFSSIVGLAAGGASTVFSGMNAFKGSGSGSSTDSGAKQGQPSYLNLGG